MSDKPVITIHEMGIGETVKTDDATITRTDNGYSVSRWEGRIFHTAWEAWNAAGGGRVEGAQPLTSETAVYIKSKS